jgi:hypothetical protein
MTGQEFLNEIPAACQLIDEGHLSWEQLREGITAFGGEVKVTGDRPSGSEAVELFIPGTSTNIKIGSAGLALLRMLLSGAALVTAPQTLVAWPVMGAAGVNFGDACYRLRKAIQTLSVTDGELCVYLALAESRTNESRAAGIFPSAEIVAATLDNRGGEWCGLYCRFHRRNHDVVTATAVGEVLSFLASTRSVVAKKSASTWWVA